MVNVLKIRELRREKGISQADMSSLLSLSLSCYQKYEQGQRKMSEEIAQRCAVILGVDYGELKKFPLQQDSKEYLFAEKIVGLSDRQKQIVNDLIIYFEEENDAKDKKGPE